MVFDGFFELSFCFSYLCLIFDVSILYGFQILEFPWVLDVLFTRPSAFDFTCILDLGFDFGVVCMTLLGFPMSWYIKYSIQFNFIQVDSIEFFSNRVLDIHFDKIRFITIQFKSIRFESKRSD